MQVTIKVVESRELFETVASSFGAIDGWAMRFLREHGITYRLTFSASELRPEDLLCFPEAISVIVVQVSDNQALKRLSALGQCVSGLRKKHESMPFIASPTVAVLNEKALNIPNYELPDFVSEWMLERDNCVELTHRILRALRARKFRKIPLKFGTLVMLPDSRSVVLDAASVRLSPAEFALAELFLARLGTVISLSELTEFFRSTGKSTELNNIRVTVHQLRLKLEELTRSNLRLCTIYRKGYCLRQSHRGATDDDEQMIPG